MTSATRSAIQPGTSRFQLTAAPSAMNPSGTSEARLSACSFNTPPQEQNLPMVIGRKALPPDGLDVPRAALAGAVAFEVGKNRPLKISTITSRQVLLGHRKVCRTTLCQDNAIHIHISLARFDSARCRPYHANLLQQNPKNWSCVGFFPVNA